MEIGNYVSQQLLLFLRSIGLGICLGLLYDLLGALRTLGGKLLGGVLDAAFCLTAAAAVLLFVLSGDGELRIFVALGILGGAVLFRYLAGPLLRPVWAFWLRLALLPARLVQKLLKKWGRKTKKGFSFFRNWFTMKITTLRRERNTRRQEGDDDMSRPSGTKKAPQKKKRKPAKAVRSSSKLTVLILAALLMGISIQIYRMFGQLREAKAEEISYTQQLEALRTANSQLQEDLDNSGDQAVIEDIARDKLGMVTPGEKVFHISK
ncbi:MAG: septum formation initiator family protein [Oscillospiraceae bacterium]|nr:septum formation initiator family protein [Oscillospiraceae bacterium]